MKENVLIISCLIGLILIVGFVFLNKPELDKPRHTHQGDTTKCILNGKPFEWNIFEFGN